MRQYGYIQIFLRPLTTIGYLEPEDVVVAFQDFAAHVLSQQERGRVVLEEELWKYERGTSNGSTVYPIHL